MAKRIYWATAGAGGVAGLFIIMNMLFASGIITDYTYSGDMACAGTEEDPCYAYFNFTVTEDVFIYPIGYDPYGRETPVDFTPGVKDWKIERWYGRYWYAYDLTKPCDDQRCGKKRTGETKYSLAWRKGKSYQIRVTAYKHHPDDVIKWSAFGDLIDPYWYPPGHISNNASTNFSINVTVENVTTGHDVETVLQNTSCSPTNATCEDTWMKPVKVQHNFTELVYTHVGVSVEGFHIAYKNPDGECLQTGSRLCCWPNGYTKGLHTRSAYWKQHIKQNEKGCCLDLATNLTILEQQGDACA